MAERQKNLRTRSVDAVFWGAGGTFLRLALQMGSQITMARILGPDQYGLFAIGATVISFSAFFSDVGLAYGLIQKASVGERDIRFVSTWQLVLGVLVMLVVWQAASLIAAFFGEPRAVHVVEVLSVVCLANALAAPSLNLLKRDLDFRSIQIAQLSSFVVGYLVVGVPCALHGSQVWALVTAWIVQAVLNTLLLYRATKHAVRPLLWYEHARSQSGYGATVLVTNLVNWCINNIDRVVVGRVFGSRDIGLYATSYNLLYNPTTSLLGIVQQVFFSASSRVASEQERVTRAYLALLAAVTLFIVPVFVCVAAAPETFMGALYGLKWAAAGELCRPLALAMPLFLIWGLTTPLLWTSGNAGREFRSQLPVAVVWLLACMAASRVSVVAVAWTVAALFALRSAVIIRAVLRSMQMDVAPVFGAMRGGLAVSAVVAFAVVLADHLGAELHALPRLLFDAVAGGAGWYALVRNMPALIAPDLATLLGQVVQRAPAGVARRLTFLSRGR